MPKKKDQQKSFQKQRDYLLAQHDGSPIVPPPFNIKVPIAGSCIITKSPLGLEGYAAQEHREAYTSSGGRFSGEHKNALHLCGRRYCIQPSHIYAGSASDNHRDVRLHKGKRSTFGDLETLHRIAMERAEAVSHDHQLPLRLPQPTQVLSCGHEWFRDQGCGICGVPARRPEDDWWICAYFVYAFESDTYVRESTMLPRPKPGSSDVLGFQPLYAGQTMLGTTAQLHFEYHPRLAIVRHGGVELRDVGV